MPNATQSQTNVTVGLQHQGSLERALFSSLSTLPCCVFLCINGVMLFSMRSKPVLRETPRYILLYNLLFADTIQLALGQLLYILAACGIKLKFHVCGILTMLSNLTSEISPLTLVVMSLERYVAVCYPLRHAAIITIRSTAVAIALVWAFSFLNVLIRVLLLLSFPFEDLESLQMNDFCSAAAMRLLPVSDYYDKAYKCVFFLSAGAAIICSYIGVMVAARSASTDKASASKARNTVLLHLMQLGLILSSAVYSTLITAMSRTLERIIIARVNTVLYVCIFIFPRCLSPLIYGLRDQIIRPILMYHLCCRLKLSVIPEKAEI